VTVFREDIFKLAVGNDSVYENSNDNVVGVVIFATLKNLFVSTTVLPHYNIHKFVWKSPD
jgi:hypothetical protein